MMTRNHNRMNRPSPIIMKNEKKEKISFNFLKLPTKTKKKKHTRICIIKFNFNSIKKFLDQLIVQ